MSESLNKIKAYRRQILIDLYNQCTEPQQMIFKRMYSHKNLELGINDIINKMPDDKIDWSIQQCEKTVEKNKL